VKISVIITEVSVKLLNSTRNFLHFLPKRDRQTESCLLSGLDRVLMEEAAELY